jgi:thioredoxin 1
MLQLEKNSYKGDNMKVVKKDEFDVLVKGNKPVLVDFFATWCGPCKMLAPILDQVGAESDGKFEVVKVDVDESYDLAKRFGIMSVPTMIIFKNGEEKEKIIGLRQKSQILETIKKYL